MFGLYFLQELHNIRISFYAVLCCSAGGNVKTTSLIAFTTTLLAWGGIDYKDAYVEAGEMDNLLDQIKWSADYLMKCRISPTSLVAQVSVAVLCNSNVPKSMTFSTKRGF